VGLLRADMVLARRFLGSPWAAEEIWREVERKKPVRAAIPAGVDLPKASVSWFSQQRKRTRFRRRRFILNIFCLVYYAMNEILRRPY
jgi:hypothetical protein